MRSFHHIGNCKFNPDSTNSVDVRFDDSDIGLYIIYDDRLDNFDIVRTYTDTVPRNDGLGDRVVDISTLKEGLTFEQVENEIIDLCSSIALKEVANNFKASLHKE